MEILTKKEFFARHTERNASGKDEQVDEVVLDIIRNVRTGGDKVLVDLTEQLDNVRLAELVVTASERKAAWDMVSDRFVHALKTARDNITVFHEAQKESTWFLEQTDQKTLGQKVTPMERVGIYVPGGKAAYPSTVLMNGIPAKIAGVGELVMVTPPDENGSIRPEVLVAAELAGIDRIYKVGGAQAIAALAYGTETITKVHKIVGPGNAYVARAKKWVYGDVAIDMIAGPSEICVVADSTAPPAFVAADLLSQAEHDEHAAAICVTLSIELAESIQQEVQHQMKSLDRKDIVAQSLEQNGGIIVARNMAEALEVVNELAPEHLELMIENPETYLDEVHHAGAIFLGNYSPEPLGDYVAGPNHTLPTSGTAKFASPLGVNDFMKKSSIIHYDKDALFDSAEAIMTLAQAEQLTAHAHAIQIRKDENDAASGKST